MAKPANAKARLAVVIVVLLAVLAGVGYLLFGRGAGLEYVQFANGFEFPVTVKVTPEGGKETTLTLPPKSRLGADFEGSCTLVFSGPQGEMKTRKMKFAPSGERKKGCYEYVNVLGSAAIVEEDVVYGLGIKGGVRIVAGRDHQKLCPRWGFETEKPPEAVSVKKDRLGINLTWLHYAGSGDWHDAIKLLLAQKPEADDRSRILAFNLAFAMVKQDPANPRLKPLEAELDAACDRMVDLFTSGPLAGKARRDCHANTKALFSKL